MFSKRRKKPIIYFMRIEWFFIWTNLGWNWSNGSWEKDFFLNYVNIFLLFRNYLPLEKGGALHLNKLEFLSPKYASCQVWLKLTRWFWRRRWKIEKFTTTTTTPTTTTPTTTTNNGKIWSEKLTWAFGSGELKRVHNTQ